ncbi:polyprenyl synthetase family protein [Streptomyces brevispora]|uniref:Geranylgeranyl diphosphate synthase type I n=1 Tax=Streptomyces brevispora TaxID=887462 RepID=A0A561V5Q9_9ACTN|nr:polyprenyl synthetase family protein [Streptomyces brevispora]TWG06935.1 geranylgeranyl diphosphate synthase type I [Streptomyces brevispora]WSC12208.1 polyprenyl synthetase family protein [Streptomyces brevispora]
MDVRDAGDRTDTVYAVLAQARQRVLPAVREAVDGLPGAIRHLVGVHYGWWDEAGTPLANADTGAGKGLRPALVLLAGDAVGGDRTAAVPAAVAVDLAHNASLLHDDVIDRDATRRHRPAIWSSFGIAAAILAGDALLILANQVLARAPVPLCDRGLSHFNASGQQLIDGEYADARSERCDEAVLEECVAMAAAKTGALLAASCALGAIAGGAQADRVEHLRAFGEDLGLALQLVDDLLSIWGTQRNTGKPHLSDLRARRKTLPVAAALAHGGTASRRLADLYRSRTPLTHADLREVTDLIEAAGGRAWAQGEAERRHTLALAHLALARPQPAARHALTAVADLIIHRHH